MKRIYLVFCVPLFLFSGEVEDSLLIKGVLSGQPSIVLKAIKDGADMNAQKGGISPLILACWKGKVSCAKILIEKGADVHLVDREGNTPLMLASKGGFSEIVKSLLTVDQLVENKTSSHGWTALMFAASTGNCEISKLLLNAGARVDTTNNYGGTALIQAAMEGKNDCIRMLIQAGADVDHQTLVGETALIWSVKKSHLPTVKLLLSSGADPTIRSSSDATAILLAKEGKNRAIYKLLKKAAKR